MPFKISLRVTLEPYIGFVSAVVGLHDGSIQADSRQKPLCCANNCHPPIAPLSATNSSELLAFRRVHCNLGCARRLHDVPGSCYFIRCAMSHNEEFVGLEC